MSKRIGYSLSEVLKNEFDKCIQSKYGYKRNSGKKELEKAIKLYLTFEGSDSYREDPDVKELLNSLRDNTSAHTQKGASGQGNMDMFAQAFVKEHKDRKQVTKSELSYFASFVQGVTDHRSVQNRINYLIGSGVLIPTAHNIFEIQKIGENRGFR